MIHKTQTIITIIAQIFLAGTVGNEMALAAAHDFRFARVAASAPDRPYAVLMPLTRWTKLRFFWRTIW